MMPWQAVVILLTPIILVLAFAAWIARNLIAQHRKTQRIDAEYDRWELAENINRLEHDLGLHAAKEDSCRSCHYDKLWPLPVKRDRQRR